MGVLTAPRRLFAGSVVLAGLAWALGAAAAPRTHDGFFIQPSVGVSFVQMDGELSLASTTETQELTGRGPVFDLLVGASVTRHLVVGGMLAMRGASNPKFESDSLALLPSEDSRDTVSLVQLGLFVQVYPDPASGLFFRGAVGAAGDSMRYELDLDPLEPSGFGLSAAAGWGFWVGDEWSMGPELHIVYASLSDEQDSIELTHDWLAPGFAVVFTHH